MPIPEIVNIRPSGGDFTSIGAFITGYAGGFDLVTRDVLLEVRVWDEFPGDGFLDEGTSGANFNGSAFITDMTRYILIKANPGDEANFSMSSGARIKGTGKFNPVVNTTNNVKVLLENVTILHSPSPVDSNTVPAVVFKITNCLIKGESTNTPEIFASRQPDGTLEPVQIENSIIYRDTHGNTPIFGGSHNQPVVINKGVFIGGYVDCDLFSEGDATFDMTNTVIYNTAGTTFNDPSSGSKPLTIDNCAFSDATGVGTNKLVSIATSQFTDYANANYTTASGSSMQTNGIGVITTTPGLTVDQANLVPGGTISGTFVDYGSLPTSPAVLTDSNGNTLNVTVTVSGTAASGTFSGTMPSLPASGNTASFLLFGNVTVELT